MALVSPKQLSMQAYVLCMSGKQCPEHLGHHHSFFLPYWTCLKVIYLARASIIKALTGRRSKPVERKTLMVLCTLCHSPNVIYKQPNQVFKRYQTVSPVNVGFMQSKTALHQNRHLWQRWSWRSCWTCGRWTQWIYSPHRIQIGWGSWIPNHLSSLSCRQVWTNEDSIALGLTVL